MGRTPPDLGYRMTLLSQELPAAGLTSPRTLREERGTVSLGHHNELELACMTSQPKRSGAIRTAAINLFVLVTILWVTNSCSSLILDVQYSFEPYFTKADSRAKLLA
ncbi:MAG TPA: hypothetical protein EYG46_04635 [Myxococcales bacterium]|nr:hypothetical protein [Myxococcales bacterium]